MKKQTIFQRSVFFLVPFIIFYSYFLVRGSILTVDLGQQYIDLLQFYRSNLFTHPLKLIYSFSNGLGGSMIATNAYYLASPLNLLLFLFPAAQLPQAIMLIIACKIGLCGLTAGIFFKQQSNFTNSLSLAMAYSLCGFNLANHLNLMWLDSVYLLPLIIRSGLKLITTSTSKYYLLVFFALITNFYTGYMALLFSGIYLVIQVLISQQKMRDKMQRISQLIMHNLLGALLAAFLLVPTFAELLAGKAQPAPITLTFQKQPWNLLGKFLLGAFDFHEMEAGSANVFIATALLLLAVSYFFDRKIALKQRLANLCLLAFLILSCIFNPLILLWHLGQYPIWYPARMSFVIAFLLLMLAQNELEASNLTLMQKVAPTVFSFLVILTATFNYSKLSYLTSAKLLSTSLIFASGLLFIYFASVIKYRAEMLFALTTVSICANMLLSLQGISYQRNVDYQHFYTNMNKLVKQVKTNEVVRFDKTFYRSDDDPFSTNYYGLSSFNSVSNRAVTKFISQLGLAYNSNSFNSENSTVFAEKLLGAQYIIKPNFDITQVNSQDLMKFDHYQSRPDLYHYQTIKEFEQLLLIKNPGFSLAFLTKNNQINYQFGNNALANQNQLFQGITGYKLPLFTKTNLLKQAKTVGNSVTYKIRVPDDATYYLYLPSSAADQISINHVKVTRKVRDAMTQIIPLAGDAKNSHVLLSIRLANSALGQDNLQIWRMNTKLLKTALKATIKNLPLTQASDLSLTSQKFTGHYLKTTIAFSNNWRIFDKGKPVKTRRWANTFLAANLGKGTHHLTLSYQPTELLLGLFFSFAGIIICIFYSKKARR